MVASAPLNSVLYRSSYGSRKRALDLLLKGKEKKIHSHRLHVLQAVLASDSRCYLGSVLACRMITN